MEGDQEIEQGGGRKGEREVNELKYVMYTSQLP